MSARVEGEEVKGAVVSESLLAKRLKSGVFHIDENGDIEKRCSKCRDYWPADTEFFYATKVRDGLTDWCKACYVEWRFPEGRGAVLHFGLENNNRGGLHV